MIDFDLKGSANLKKLLFILIPYQMLIYFYVKQKKANDTFVVLLYLYRYCTDIFKKNGVRNAGIEKLNFCW